MDELLLISLMRDSVWTAVLISTPILAVALIVGLVIGLLQALTSIQELTLTFVPKLAAMLAVFWSTMSYSGGLLVAFYQDQVLRLIAAG